MLNRSNETFRGWTVFNFKNNTVYLFDGGYFAYDLRPANQYQHNFFIDTFFNRGKKTCTFKEFRESCHKFIMNTPEYLNFKTFYDFDHRKPNSIQYGFIVLDRHSFTDILSYMNDPEHDQLIDGLRNIVRELNTKNAIVEEKYLQKDKKDSVLKFLKSLEDVVKNIEF